MLFSKDGISMHEGEHFMDVHGKHTYQRGPFPASAVQQAVHNLPHNYLKGRLLCIMYMVRGIQDSYV
jgi:hypothetical protein